MTNEQGQARIKKGFKLTRLYSLSGIINLSLVTLIVAVMVLAYTTYSKLSSFEQSLNSMMDKSLPSVIQSGKLYSQMNLLLSGTEQLSMANSEAMRRIATNTITRQIDGLHKLSQEHEQTYHITSQLSSVERELDELNQLVKQRIAINTRIARLESQLYHLQRQVTEDLLVGHSAAVSASWQLLFSRIMLLSAELTNLDQLSEIRQRQEALDNRFNSLSALADSLPAEQQQSAQLAIAALSETVLHPETGLIALRQLQLKILGRVQGRSNFVRNLIADYARLNEFESHQLNQAVLTRAANTSKLVEQQVKQASLLFIILLFAYIGFAVFIQRVVVNRLKTLNKQVQRRSTGQSHSITVTGNDEITELAQSFERFASTIELQKNTLEEMSLRDALTDIANRRAFDDYYSQALNVATRQRWPLTVLLIDVDYFKQYNDNYGHSQGDVCLKQVANLIKQQMPRKTDILARYGGEEFAVLLPDTDTQGAVTVAKHILDAFKNAQIPHDFSGVADHVTVSIGISVGQQQDGSLTLPSIEAADKALYRAKRTGRNRWVNDADEEEQ
ncbi:diguanylate cyclase [uncultured Alteromonas sp.]|jgi:diguanylate cyclase (GGDEF)-like protein|uniref:diguanylate cyclase n=1 Tax=uncultured Alteromonas sp. TaxID=179113 RepID=UPI0025FA2CD9|nr:diguanylate cyclase [uncultured Alteromonas sp.]